MEVLNRLSPLKIFAKHGYTTTLLPSRSTLSGRSSIGFLGSPSFKTLEHGNLDLFRAPDASPINRSHGASHVAELLTGLDAELSRFRKSRRSKTVHLRFEVQKKCRFGEQFLLAGDAPMMGVWDPLSAIPMSWSEGNLWILELDAPVDLTMQFKFILKRNDGEIVWQPGPDRIFKTWASRNTLVIEEDWENAQAQKIIEEPFVDGVKKMEIYPSTPAPTVVGNGSNQRGNRMLSSNNARLKDPMNVSNEFVNAKEEMKEEPTNNNNHIAGNGKSPTAGEDKETVIGIEEGSVLIPGLAAPLQGMTAENALAKELESIIAESVRIDAGEDHNVPK